jgi:F0F1-type ATP synthase membrane subunit b/b'
MGGKGLNEQAAGGIPASKSNTSVGSASTGKNTFLHNEKGIQQVLEIEKRAQAIHEAALREAEQLPIQAEQEAQTLIEKSRAEAVEQARQLTASAQAQEECARILAQAEEEVRRMETLAMSHFDRAVGYVLDRVIGRE